MAEAVALPAEGRQTTVSIRDSVSGRRLIFILIGVVLGMLLAALDNTIVGTAMPTIIANLGGLAHYSWVFTAYMLASTVTVPIYGKLSDIFGRRFFFILAMVLFLAGSALSGLSHNMTELILFRGLQGIGAGGLMPLAMAIIGDVFPPAQRAKWGAALTAIFGISTIIGPSLGGFITDHFGWPWVFYVNMPIGALAIATTAVAMPGHSRRQSHSIDYLGVATLIGWSMPLLLALSLGGSEYRWGSVQIIGMLAVALIMLGVFLIVESRAKEPLLSLAFFKNPIFSVSMIVTFLTAMGMFGAISFLPLFVQGVVGTDATNAGAVLTPMMLGFMISSIISGQVMARTGRYKIVALVGFAIGAVGLFFLSRMGIDATNGIIVQRMILTGLGIGVSMSLFTIIVQNAFPLSQMGAATAALTFFRSIGGTVGLALLGSVMTNRFNSEFDTNLPATLKQAIPADKLEALRNPQLLLSHDATNRIHDSFAAMGAQGDALFGQLMLALRQSLATAITSLFFVATIAMVLALIATVFLKEIPLRKSNAPEIAPAAAMPSDAPAPMPARPAQPVPQPAPVMAAAAPPVAYAAPSPPPGIPVNGHAPAQPAFVAAYAAPTNGATAPVPAAPGTEREEAERLVGALEQFMRQQTGVAREVYDALAQRVAALEQTADAPVLSPEIAGRMATLEQGLTALDRLVHSLPPASWHRMQDARMTALEQRIVALEELCRHLATESSRQHDRAARTPAGMGAYGFKYAD